MGHRSRLNLFKPGTYWRVPTATTPGYWIIHIIKEPVLQDCWVAESEVILCSQTFTYIGYRKSFLIWTKDRNWEDWYPLGSKQFRMYRDLCD